MTVKRFVASGLATAILALAGCGEGNKSETPKDLKMKLPNPPVGAGGGGGGKAPPPPTNNAQ
jgi:hypothetical protein